MELEDVTPYAVHCPFCGFQCLAKAQYARQMDHPDARWQCPQCGYDADWDDDWFESEYQEFMELSDRYKAEWLTSH